MKSLYVCSLALLKKQVTVSAELNLRTNFGREIIDEVDDNHIDD